MLSCGNGGEVFNYQRMKIYKLGILIIILCFCGNSILSQQRDTVFPDLTFGFGGEPFLYEEIQLNNLSSIYGNISPTFSMLNLTSSLRRYHLMFRYRDFQQKFTEEVETIANFSFEDTLRVRKSLINLGYRFLLNRRFYVQPSIQINFERYRLIDFNSSEKLDEFSLNPIGIGLDLGGSWMNARVVDFENIFYDMGAALQFRYLYSKGLPIIESGLNNHVFTYNLLIYVSVGWWELFDQDKKREKI